MRLITIFAFLFIPLVLFGQKKRVVVETSLGEGVDRNVKDWFMNALEPALNESDQFVLITNRNEYSQQIQGQLEAQEGGLIRDDQWITLGKAYQAEMVVYANIVAIGTQYQITIKLFEIETGISHKTIRPIYCDLSNMKEGAEQLYERLSSIDGERHHNKSANYIQCYALPNSVIDRNDRSMKEWDEAQSECEQIGPGWRLPTKIELGRIIQYVKNNPSSLGHKWMNTTYWSSNERSSSTVYTVEYPSAYVTYESKNSKCIFRCIKTD